jgi:hypothetical protein
MSQPSSRQLSVKCQRPLALRRTTALSLACFVAVIVIRASLYDSTVYIPPVQTLNSRIGIICVVMPSRMPYMQRLLSDLELRAPGEFSVTFVPAVMALSDSRVSGWTSNAAFTRRKSAYLPTLSHMLAMDIAAKAEMPSIVVEDDIMIHKSFHKVVSACIRHASLIPLDTVFQLGYIHPRGAKFRRLEGMLKPESTTFCIQSGAEGDVVIKPLIGKQCLHDADASAGDFSVGLSREQNPFGAQAYIVRPQHARIVWETRYATMHNKSNTESRIFSALSPHYRTLRIVPPLAVEDHPRFATTLGHWRQSDQYDLFSQLTKGFKDYYCPDVRDGSGKPLFNATASQCIP